MIKASARQHHKSACQFRRLSTGNDQAHRRAALDSRRVVRSPLRDAGSAYREIPIGFVTLDRFPNSRSMGRPQPTASA
jgi:hypothetical protein